MDETYIDVDLLGVKCKLKVTVSYDEPDPTIEAPPMDIISHGGAMIGRHKFNPMLKIKNMTKRQT